MTGNREILLIGLVILDLSYSVGLVILDLSYSVVFRAVFSYVCYF